MIHHLDDLFASDLAERAAEDGEVLTVDGNLTAVDGAEPGDDRVAIWALLFHAEGVCTVPNELVKLDEGTVVEQLVDALARGLFALGVLFIDGGLAARGHRLVIPHLEVGQLARRRKHVGVRLSG